MAAAAAAAVSREEDARARLQIYAVDEYSIESSKKDCVCFSTLPLRSVDAVAAAGDVPQGGSSSNNNNNKVLFLRGFHHGQRRRIKVFNRVVAWRLELDGAQPEFFLLPQAKERGWLRLVKPFKLYERTARTVLMTAQVLHFLRRNPDVPEKALWNHLRRAFRTFFPEPSDDDFRNQTSVSLMRKFAATDPVLANSEAL